MKRKKGLRIWGLSVISLLLLFAVACSNTATTANEPMAEPSGGKVSEGKPVKLRWLLAGPGKQADSDKVWAEFNKRLSQYLPNTTVEFEAIDLAKFEEKFKLVAASGENYDIAWTGYKNSLPDNVKRGAFLPLDELLEKSAPELKEALPDYMWEKMKFDGKIYAVPAYQQTWDTNVGIKLHKSLAEKFALDTGKLEETLASNEFITQEIYDQLGDYLQKLKDNNELRKGVSVETTAWLADKGTSSLYKDFVIAREDQSGKILLKYERPEYKMMIGNHAEWFKKGFIRKDVLSIQDRRADEKKEDGYVLYVTTQYNADPEFPQVSTNDMDSSSFGYPVISVPVTPKSYYIPSGDVSTHNAISASSNNPERAIQLLSLLYSEEGKDLYNLLVWGLEGVHYNKVSENRIETIDYVGQGTMSSKYGQWKWTIGNTFHSWLTQADADGLGEYVLASMNKAKVSPLVDFKINIEPVKNELAYIDAIVKEYNLSLYSGAVDNYEQRYQEFMDKLKKAGSDKVKEEFQKQINEYLSNK